MFSTKWFSGLALAVAQTAFGAPSVIDDETFVAQALQEDGLHEIAIRWPAHILVVAVPKDGLSPIRRYSFAGLYSDTNANGVMDQNDAGFFNPASTIKFGLTLAVLENLHARGVPRSAEYRAEGETEWHTFERDLSLTLVFSDNDATNRLIRFLGFQEINERIRSHGVRHWELGRLMISKEVLGQSVPHEIREGASISTTVPQAVTMVSSCQEVPTQNGNCAAPDAQADLLLRLSHPERFSDAERFAFPDETRVWLLEVLRSYPRDLGFDAETYPDKYLKVHFPLQQELFPGHRVASKYGYAPYTITASDISFFETDGPDDFITVIGSMVRPSWDPPPTEEEGREVNAFIAKAARAVLTRLK